MTKTMTSMFLMSALVGKALAVEYVPYEYKEEILKAEPSKTISDGGIEIVKEDFKYDEIEVPKIKVEAIPSVLTKTWTMDVKDVTYYNAFIRWAKEANYQIRWDAPSHFYIGARDTFEGSFEDALEAAITNPAVSLSRLPLEVCFYPNTPPLARITRKGEQEMECK